MRTIITCAALVAATLTVCPHSAFAQGRTVVRRTQAEAERAIKAGSLQAAAAKYRKLMFAGSRKARTKYARLQKQQVKHLVASARRLRQADPAKAIALLEEAHGIDPRDRLVTKELRRHGRVYFQGELHTKDELAGLRDRARKRGLERRRELELGREFTLIQRGAFRFYTDLNMRYGRKVLIQMMNAVQAHYAKYCQVMRPAGIHYPKGGLDVVLFKSEREYQDYVRTPGSAGVYIPRKRAGFFFSGSAGFNFPTLLHEMTHQLNHKVLGGTRFTPWFEEGIAEYFGSGVLSHGGRRLTLGRPQADRLLDFREMLLAKPQPRTASLDQFFGMQAQLTGGYYAQSWALVNYLMTGPVYGKLIVFDLIQAGKAKQKAKGPGATLDAREMRELLAAYDLTPEKLEASYTAFYLGNR